MSIIKIINNQIEKYVVDKTVYIGGNFQSIDKANEFIDQLDNRLTKYVSIKYIEKE